MTPNKAAPEPTPDPLQSVLTPDEMHCLNLVLETSSAGTYRITEALRIIRDLAARLAAAERERDAAVERLEQIADVCRAYPPEVFAEPDLDKARRLLEGGGVSLDSVSAKAARTVADYIITLATNKTRAAPELPDAAREGE